MRMMRNISLYVKSMSNSTPALMGDLHECEDETGKKLPVTIPSVIEENSIIIKSWEANSRYNDNMVVLRKNILQVIKACDAISVELIRNGFK